MSRYTANMPSVGITSFMKLPIQEDLADLDADVGFLGIPYDAGNSWRPGTRFGPREIRTYSRDIRPGVVRCLKGIGTSIRTNGF